MKQELTLDMYLEQSEYIDYHDLEIQKLIVSFKEKGHTDLNRVQRIYEYVRDEIKHSYDIKSDEVTRRASEVLDKKHGICYAKSHLLAALLRGVGVPAGICYQKLTLFDLPEDGYCIHALNTVYIREFNKWIRLDARGNKEGVIAQFSIAE